MKENQHNFITYHQRSIYRVGKAGVPEAGWPEEWLKIVFKGYPRFEKIALPPPQFTSHVPLHEIIQGRRSQREFAKDDPLTLAELSRVLSALQMTEGHENSAYGSRRAYASTGGLYPIEAYILPLRVRGLQPWLHHYHVRSHSLEKLWAFSELQFRECFAGEEWCAFSGAAIVLTACHSRLSGKYGERAYRFCLLEAGQIAQNIQLICQSEGLGCCNYGGFVDAIMMPLLDINPQEELIVHTLLIGKREEGSK